MPSYLIEVFAPSSSGADPHEAGTRVRLAVQELATGGAPIRYVRTTLVPGDEICFHLVEAESAELVERACSRALLTGARVVPVIEAAPTG